MTQSAAENLADGSHLFHELIVHTARQTLLLVQQAGEKLSPDEQEQVKNILSYALKLELAWEDARKLVALAAPIMEMKGQRQEWAAFLNKAIVTCEKRADWQSLAEFQHQASVLYRLMAQLEPAWRHANEATANFARSGNKRQQAIALAERAWIEQEQGKYNAATKSIQQSLELLISDRSNDESDPELANYHRVMGTIALYQSKYAQAEHHYQQSLIGFQRHHDKRRTAWSLQNMGLVLSHQKKYRDAIYYYTRAASQTTELGDIYYLAHICFNQGVAHAALEEFQDALTCYQIAIPIYLQMDDRLRLSRIYTDMGLALYKLKNYPEAAVQFQASINLAIALRNESWRLNAMDGLGMTMIEQAEYDAAIRLLETAISDLPLIQHASNFEYLTESLNRHLEDAKLRRRNRTTASQ